VKEQRPLWDRFFEKVAIRDYHACWIWTGAKSMGYGAIGTGGRNEPTRYAHRLIYEAIHGKLPDDWQVDHLCRVRACVNPHHLEGVTQIENLRRQAAAQPKRTHCKRGHEFTPENTDQTPKQRRCRTCRRKAGRATYHRRKAAA
jgi:hypothetical protein